MTNKILWLLLSLITLTGYSQKVSKNAIGLRLSSNNGQIPEISYQRGLNTSSRLEFDLSLKNDQVTTTVQLAALYQYVWNIDGGLNWYAGGGAGVGNWRSNNSIIYKTTVNNGTYAFLAGDIGIEYNFDFPLLISFDVRPQFGILNYNNPLDLDIGIGARYQF